MNFEDYESLPTNNVVTHMTAGAIAGVMEHCVMYPLDSVKVSRFRNRIHLCQPQAMSRFKVKSPLLGYVEFFDFSQTRMQSLTTTGREGIVETFLRMVRHEGVFRPVRGMSAMVVGAGPSHALYFSSYEYLKNAMIKSTTTSRYHTAIYGKGPNPRCLSQG
jgi:solute carrier family 25 iron transporter 28/37